LVLLVLRGNFVFKNQGHVGLCVHDTA